VKAGHVHAERRELVVPAEDEAVERCAKRDRTTVDHDSIERAARTTRRRLQAGRSNSRLGRKLLEHVEQGLLVHQLVLDHHLEDAHPRRHDAGR
jgi:hypothetical protein